MSRIGVALVLVVVMTASASAQIADPWPQDPQPASDPVAKAPDPGPKAPDPAPEPPAPAPKPPDPETIDASEIPLSVPPPPPPYPRALVERPLMLPARTSEIHARVGFGRETFEELRHSYSQLSVGGRFSTGTVEPYLSAQVLPFSRFDGPMSELIAEPPFVQRVIMGAGFAIAHETVVGVQGVVGNIGSDFQRYSPSLWVEHKIRTSEYGAIVVGGGVDYNYQNDSINGWSYAAHRVSAFGSANAILQMTPLVALEVSGTAAQYKFLDDNHSPDTYRAYWYGSDLVLSVTERVDIVPSIGFFKQGELHAMAGGFTVRLH